MEQYYFDTLALHPPPERLESFTSYIIRLAQANGLKTMQDFAYVFFPDQKSRGLAKYFTDYTPPSFGTLTKVAVCCETKLEEMTFFHLAAKFDHTPWHNPLCYFLRRVISPYLRYCPKCLVESPSPYYSLIWRFLLIPQCHRHKRPLLDRCGHCGQRMPIFSLPPRMAACPICGGDLRNCLSSSNFSSKALRASIDVDNLEFLLMPHICEEVKTRVTSVGALLASMRRSRKLSVPQLSKTLQLKLGEVQRIEQSTLGTTLLHYVIYASYMGVSLRYLFNAACSQDIPHWQSPEERYIRLVKEAIPRLEQLFLPVQMSTVSQLTGVSAHTLGNYSRIKTLLALYQEKDYIKEKRQLLREEELLKKAYEARDSLLALGKSITVDRICKHLQICNNSLTEYPRVKELVHRFCEENRAKRVEARDLREVNLVEKVMIAIQHLSSLHLPITIKSVGKIVGVSPYVLRYYPSTRALVDHSKKVLLGKGTQKGGQDLAELVPSVIQQLEDSGTPVSLLEINRILGVLPEELLFSPQVRKQLELSINHASEEPLKEEVLLKLAQEMAPTVNPFNKWTLYRMIREHAGRIYGNPKKYPCVRQFVDEYAKDCQKQRREDEKARRRLQKEEERFSRLQAAVVSLQVQGKPLTWSELAEASGIHKDLFRYYPRLREYATQCINEAAATKYLIDQQQDGDLLQRLKQAIQTQRLSNQSLSRETLSRILHVSKKRLLECSKTKAVLDELQRDLQSDRLRQEMVNVERVNEAILSLRDEGYPITQRSIAKYLGIGRTLLNSYPKVREILITEMDAKYSAIDGTEQP